MSATVSNSVSIIIGFRSHGDRDGATLARMVGISPAHELQASISGVDLLYWIVGFGVALVTVLVIAQFLDY